MRLKPETWERGAEAVERVVRRLAVTVLMVCVWTYITALMVAFVVDRVRRLIE